MNRSGMHLEVTLVISRTSLSETLKSFVVGINRSKFGNILSLSHWIIPLSPLPTPDNCIYSRSQIKFRFA